MRLGRFAAVSSCVSSLLMLAPVAAHADTFNFLFTEGTNTVTFELPSSPVVSAFHSGYSFKINNETIVENGATSSMRTLEFNSSGDGGGFSLSNSAYLNTEGPQLYVGPESAPTFVPGSYNLIGYQNHQLKSQLTITDLPAPTTVTPEPSSVLLLGTGLVALAGSTRRRLTSKSSPDPA